MFRNHWKMVLGSVLLLCAPQLAICQTDQQAYCSYVMEQAKAQRDLLRTPVGTIGFTQPETGLPMQAFTGATLGLSDLRKAGLTVHAARKNCELYEATTSAEQKIQYAITSLEKDALQNRLALIERASKLLDALMGKTVEMINEQNATKVMLFSLQMTQIKLDADRSDTRLKIAALYSPPLSDQPLKDLVAEKQHSELEEQKALNKISRENNWDVALSVGAHQQVNPIAHGTQPYGEVTVTYNFASRAIDNHLDRAEAAYGNWKNVQKGDVVRDMNVLQHQLIENIGIQQAKLDSLQQESNQIEKNLQAVATPDTSAALDFHNQLTAAQLLLQIEIGDATFRISQLQQFLQKNY